MPAETIAPPAPGTASSGHRRFHAAAAALLMRAAQPERRTLLRGVAWLLLAAGLEALGPLAGKYLIDN